MSYTIARARALAAAAKAGRKTDDKVAHALDKYPHPKKRMARILHAATASPDLTGYLPLSNSSVRAVLGEALIEEMLNLYGHTGRDARARHWLFTATFDDGIVGEKAPVIPLKRIKRKVRRLLSAQRLNAICVFEIDVLAKPITGENERQLLVHVHAVVWTRDSKFKPKTVARRLSATRALQNRLGIPAIDFISRKRSTRRRPHWPLRHPERDQTARDMAWLGYYISKPNSVAKRRRQRKSGRIQLQPQRRYFRLKTALRFAEIWSQLDTADVIFGVGTGKLIARRVRARVAAWGRKQRGPENSRRAVAEAWAALFAAHTRLEFQTAVIDR